MNLINSSELTLIYDSTTESGKKAFAYASSMVPASKINRQDVSVVKLSSTFVRQVIKQLDLRPKDLMNRAHPFYQKNVRGTDLNMEGWLNVLRNNPFLLRAPIALMGDHAVICDPASRIYTLKKERVAEV